MKRFDRTGTHQDRHGAAAGFLRAAAFDAPVTSWTLLPDDYSLAEIAEQLGISRQAVHDRCTRAWKA
jgi:AraC-like DNA-binding protein